MDGRETNDRFFILQSGRVQTFKSNDVHNICASSFGPGDFLGVIPCMTGHPQIENAVAVSDATCIAVRRDQYPELIEKNTPVALKIILAFAGRMRVMNEMLTQLTLNSTSADTPEHMFEVAAYYESIGKNDIAVYAYYHYLKECPRGLYVKEAGERFAALKPRTRAVCFEAGEELARRYPQDTMIFSEGQSGSDMFVIQSGQVAVSKVVNGNEVTLAVLNKGDMFGEMALLERKPRSASAVAHSDCAVMVINRQNFDQMVRTQPVLISRLTTTLADRLWSMYRQLDNACLSDPQSKMIDMLALQVEKLKRLSGPYQTDFSEEDIANLCGIPLDRRREAFVRLRADRHVKIVNGKIFIPDCLELRKQAAFYRKQKNE